MKTIVISNNKNVSFELRVGLALALLTKKQLISINKDVMRNDPCICGSGRKFKKCCMDLFTEHLNSRK
jgi:SEC-C motif-containing protein